MQENPSRLRRRPATRSKGRRIQFELLEPRLCFSLSAPAFSSLPGANHTIYLDFNGHVTTGTTWNTGYYAEDPINSPAWSLDSDRSNFSETELATIGRIWQRVAEDFMPFQVNVTTVEPPVNDLRKGEVAGDTKWGVRAVVTIETTVKKSGAGGIAYIGSFNDFYDEPVFIYNSSENGVAEAISHEVGHSLFLTHDGTSTAAYYEGHGSGATGWAPIMGSGYTRNVTTWDQGTYFDSNNSGSNANGGYGADDLAVITSRNGFGYRVDDHGNTLASATALTVAGTSLSGSGVITTRTDVDLFSFTTGAGLVTLNINPAALRANLDVSATLLDDSGNVVATSNPADLLSASFSISLAAGNYYLKIDGTGVGSPTVASPTGYSDYASIGQYSITGTIVDASSYPSFSVEDVAISEADGLAAFTIRLTGSIAQTASVSFATADHTATTAGSDYTTGSGTLVFQPGGPTTATVQIAVNNDSLAEASETFRVLLSNASDNTLIGDSSGVATIGNDDAAFTVNDVSVLEGNANRKGVASYTNMTFTVSMPHAVNRAVSVSYSTNAAGATATAGTDYQSTSGTVTIAAGQTAANFAVTVIGDNLVEAAETFSVNISSLSGYLVDGVGVGTIQNDDSTGGGGKPAPKARLDFTRYQLDLALAEPHDDGEAGHHHPWHDAGDDHSSEAAVFGSWDSPHKPQVAASHGSGAENSETLRFTPQIRIQPNLPASRSPQRVAWTFNLAGKSGLIDDELLDSLAQASAETGARPPAQELKPATKT